MMTHDDLELQTARTRATALRWKANCEQYWPAGTLRELLPMYAEGAVVRILPNREPDIGQEAIGRAYDTFQSVARDVKCQYQSPVVDADRAVLEWWCEWTEAGQPMTMMGVTKIWVDEAGLVTEAREYWSTSIGSTPPYEGWDRDALADADAGSA